MNKGTERLQKELDTLKKDLLIKEEVIDSFNALLKNTDAINRTLVNAEQIAQKYLDTIKQEQNEKNQKLKQLEIETRNKCDEMLEKTRQECAQMKNVLNEQQALKLARSILKNQEKYENLFK